MNMWKRPWLIRMPGGEISEILHSEVNMLKRGNASIRNVNIIGKKKVCDAFHVITHFFVI